MINAMIKRPVLWAASNPRLERLVTQNPITSKAAHRFVAGEKLEEALTAAEQLNAHGIGAILDLLGEGVTDLAGATAAVNQYLEAAEDGKLGPVAEQVVGHGVIVPRPRLFFSPKYTTVSSTR